MDSDRVRHWEDHDTSVFLSTSFSSSPQNSDSLDDIFDQFIEYSASETSPLTTPQNCPGCGRTSLGSMGQSAFCDDCQSVSMLGETMDQIGPNDNLPQPTSGSSSGGSDGTGPPPSQAGTRPRPRFHDTVSRLHDTVSTLEACRAVIPTTAWAPPRQLPWLGNDDQDYWPILRAPYAPDVQERPVQQPQQRVPVLVLDRNMNEVRQPSRRRYTADERAEVRQKRGLVCEKCRKDKRRVCGHLLTLTAPTLLICLVHSCVYQCRPWGAAILWRILWRARYVVGVGVQSPPSGLQGAPVPLGYWLELCSCWSAAVL